MNTGRPDTVGGLLRAATDYLTKKDVYQPRQACDLLASRLLRCKRLELYVKYDSVMSEAHIEAMRRGVRRLAAGEPVQHIVGEVEFLGHTFKVDRRALIPRPETETLVETVLKHEPLWNAGTPVIADVGTGCGCIAISLALARPNAKYIGLDVSADAVGLARENAAALLQPPAGVVFAEGDLSDLAEPDFLDAAVANPPYVPTAEWEKLPPHIREFEPRIALDGGPDGLEVIRAVVSDACMAVKPEGAIFLEVGHDQAEKAAAIMREAGFAEPQTRKDIAGKDRVVFSAGRRS